MAKNFDYILLLAKEVPECHRDGSMTSTPSVTVDS